MVQNINVTNRVFVTCNKQLMDRTAAQEPIVVTSNGNDANGMQKPILKLGS